MAQKWKTSCINIHGKQLYFSRTGDNHKPPVILIHGFTDNGLCWSPVAADLERDFDVIMPDMHGHGLSSRLAPGDTVDMAADIAGLIKALDLNQPTVYGHSMGAAATFELGIRFPALVKAIILEDPPWWFPRRKELSPSTQNEDNPITVWAKSLAEKTYEELLDKCRMDNPSWPDELRQQMCRAKKQLDQNIIDPLSARLDQNGSKWIESIAQFNKPVLLLTGNSELGAFVTSEITKKAMELNAHVTAVNFPQAGHLIRYDNYSACIAELRSFLTRISGLATD